MKKYDIYTYKSRYEDNPQKFKFRPGVILEDNILVPILMITGAEHIKRNRFGYELKD